MVTTLFQSLGSLRRSQLCKFLGGVIVLALFASGRSGAAPTIYYVATTGSDSNAGTQAAPFRTLNRGVSVLTPGDTLRVGAGTYDETLIDNIPSGTS